MKILNRNLYPKSGYIFKESDGTIISGDSWPGVVARVKKYRIRAGLPAGNPEQEVIAQGCARDPVLCVEEDSRRKEQVKKASLKVRTLRWLVAQQSHKNELVFVTDVTARERANICAACPNNQALAEGCMTCRQAVEESRANLLGGRFRDGRLNHCNELGEDIQVSIHLDQQSVENTQLPGFCWRKRTL